MIKPLEPESGSRGLFLPLRVRKLKVQTWAGLAILPGSQYQLAKPQGESPIACFSTHPRHWETPQDCWGPGRVGEISPAISPQTLKALCTLDLEGPGKRFSSPSLGISNPVSCWTCRVWEKRGMRCFSPHSSQAPKPLWPKTLKAPLTRDSQCLGQFCWKI